MITISNYAAGHERTKGVEETSALWAGARRTIRLHAGGSAEPPRGRTAALSTDNVVLLYYTPRSRYSVQFFWRHGIRSKLTEAEFEIARNFCPGLGPAEGRVSSVRVVENCSPRAPGGVGGKGKGIVLHPHSLCHPHSALRICAPAWGSGVPHGRQAS